MAKRRLLVLVVVAAALLGTRMGASVLGHSSAPHTKAAATPLKTMPLPGGDRGEELDPLDAYWNQRLTYPTGNYNPAWQRAAVAQDKRVKRGTPGRPAPAHVCQRQGDGGRAVAQRQRLHRARPDARAHDRLRRLLRLHDDRRAASTPSSSTRPRRRNGSIVAYAATVGGGVWKTTNCCSAATTWSVTTDDPLIATIAHRHARHRPEQPQHDLRRARAT